ncbi:MAG: hypothetical protein OXU50_02995 [Gammaproteobacteria bacterium]|nr:hypothetical protein [Gammaproteobacteria bacterium]
MTKVEAIKNAIRQLSAPELEQLREWFVQYDADAWDKQIQEDAAAGRLDALAEEALNEYKATRAKPL